MAKSGNKNKISFNLIKDFFYLQERYSMTYLSEYLLKKQIHLKNMFLGK